METEKILEFNLEPEICIIVFFFQKDNILIRFCFLNCHQMSYWNTEMIFCYPNCSYLQCEETVLVIEIFFFLKFQAEGQKFAEIMQSLEWFDQTVKGQDNFW